MDPITLATVTAALTTLATECGKNAASEAGKDLWDQVKSLFGWKAEPPPSELAPDIARRLQADDALLKRVVGLLQERPAGTASALVGSIQAGKVVVATTINTENFTM